MTGITHQRDAVRPGFGYGKVILMGEHAVVYGHPALAAAIASGVSLQHQAAPDDIAIRIADWQLVVRREDIEHPVHRALMCIAHSLAADHPVALTGTATLPAGAGLGSSAAMAVAMAKTIAPDASDERICNAANAAERIFHDNPSGVDVALACHGGAGIFRKQHGFTALSLPPLQVAIGMTGQSRNTKVMVQRVADQVSNNPDDHRLLALAELTRRAQAAWTQSQWQTLGELCNSGQRVLAELTVATPTIDALCTIATQAGAWGAKLTGAGGGGSVLALAPDPDAIVAAWHRHGFDGFVTTLAQPVVSNDQRST